MTTERINFKLGSSLALHVTFLKCKWAQFKITVAYMCLWRARTAQ